MVRRTKTEDKDKDEDEDEDEVKDDLDNDLADDGRASRFDLDPRSSLSQNPTALSLTPTSPPLSPLSRIAIRAAQGARVIPA